MAKTKLDVKELMALEEQEEWEKIQRFRQTPLGKLIAQGRASNEVTFISSVNDCINKNKSHIMVWDESTPNMKNRFQEKEYKMFDEYLEKRSEFLKSEMKKISNQ